MEPPSYEEASHQPPPIITPSTPPPSYGEAMTIPQDMFPVLTPPTMPVVVSSGVRSPGITIHPVTQIGVMAPDRSVQTQSAVQAVMTQPTPVLVHMGFLTNIPGLVRCPHCHNIVTTKVKHVPGSAAWCMCALIAMMGLICGFCLIPLMVRGLQDTHHYCPQCKNHLQVYTR